MGERNYMNERIGTDQYHRIRYKTLREEPPALVKFITRLVDESVALAIEILESDRLAGAVDYAWIEVSCDGVVSSHREDAGIASYHEVLQEDRPSDSSSRADAGTTPQGRWRPPGYATGERAVVWSVNGVRKPTEESDESARYWMRADIQSYIHDYAKANGFTPALSTTDPEAASR